MLRNATHSISRVDIQPSAVAVFPVGHEPIRSYEAPLECGSRLLALGIMSCVLFAACSKVNHQGSGTSSPGGDATSGAGGWTANPDAGGGGAGGSAGGSTGGHAGASSAGGTMTGGSRSQDAGGGGPVAGGGASARGGAGGTAGSETGGAGTGGVDAANTTDAAPAVDRSPSETASSSTFLHVDGAHLVDAYGKTARFTGVNWFGFETSNESPHGTWARDYRSMLKQIRDLGFNSVRLPYSNAIMRPDAKAASVNTVGADPYDGTDPMNQDLAGKTPLEMMDLVIAAAGELGLRMILDNHSREPDGYMNEEVWYTAKTSEQQWIDDWVSLAKRYKGNPTVVAFDLDNEPHGKASWGTGVKDTDWNSAAERCGNAILAANPDVLIIVEGVSIVGTDSYWWGGNLSGVRTKPIVLSHPEKLVYSAHEYGPEVHEQPWFSDASFPNNLATVWNQHFDFIMKQGLGHILLGEFGIKDRSASGGKSGQWFDTLLKQLGSTYSWTFWCWNPNSGDTEGILQYDWLTPQQWKIDALKPYLAPFVGK